MNKNKKAFTLVELIVVISILSILSTIGFMSYVGYIIEARNSTRFANMGEMKIALKLQKQQRGSYPIPGNYFEITNSGKTVALQGKFDKNVKIQTMNELYVDPVTKSSYIYSVTANKQDYQLALTLESQDTTPITLLKGSYQSVSKNVLPTIILGTGTTNDIEIHTGILNGSDNRNLFLVDGGYNLAYKFEEPFEAYYDGIGIDKVLKSENIHFWQNSDFRKCEEIGRANKFIHDKGVEEYQILNDNGELENTGCIL